MDTNKIKKFIKDSGMFIYPSEDSLFDKFDKEDWRYVLLKEFIEEKDNGSDKLSPTDDLQALRLITEFILGINYYPLKECSSSEEVNTYTIIACAAMVMLDHYNLRRLYRENINLSVGKKEG